MQTFSNAKFADIALRYYTQAGIEKEIPQFIYNSQVLSPKCQLTLDELHISDQARIEVVFEKKKSQYHYYYFFY